MLLAALLDLGADACAIQAAYDRTGLPGLRLETSQVDIDGLRARAVRSLDPVQTSCSQQKGSGHGVGHNRLADLWRAVDRAALSGQASARARGIFAILARAEADVHGGTPESVHLHEVGDLDAVLDVVGICVALDSLGNPSASCGPLPSGRGTVRTVHGLLSCPVPAVVAIAASYLIPLVPVPVIGETITPTGIAVVAACCAEFGTEPAVDPNGMRVGVGAGTRRFADRPNIVRVYGSEAGAAGAADM
jgi:uncharacterized protein (DUF111 family)